MYVSLFVYKLLPTEAWRNFLGGRLSYVFLWNIIFMVLMIPNVYHQTREVVDKADDFIITYYIIPHTKNHSFIKFMFYYDQYTKRWRWFKITFFVCQKTEFFVSQRLLEATCYNCRIFQSFPALLNSKCSFSSNMSNSLPTSVIPIISWTCFMYEKY